METETRHLTKPRLPKKKPKRIFLLMPLLLCLACTKNDTDTIILLGTEYYVETILDAIPDTL